MPEPTPPCYDIAIVGGGCASFQLLHALSRQPGGQTLGVLLLVPEETLSRSWCFWSREPHPLRHLFAKSRLGWAGVLLLGCFLPLLLACSLYFSGWHAWHSFRAIHRYLSERNDAPPSLLRLWAKALPFTALALGALPLMAAAWRVTGQRTDPLPLLFIFLAVITLPHLRVMHGLHRRLA
ncbi:hypothetical protein OV208_21045 [Corallococcus sp. bb12-1]|uniref:Brp/Blh family beta-carotene 15,15'-dioxygenase n=1 Tax=Corallococcus sp. bb12-1 TaxID=2996784 RepID=UPI00226ED348|nr:Brp/Blh family beta-carotene 15,15'-dioxygenase [Corallococcus sp. bb12-1]MCY1043820.1 hypothetical protein [Corallococcus sp. bb12-1]